MSTHRIDRNAKAANRLRRNMQRLAHGAASSTIAVAAPVTSTGGVIGLAFLASTGLTLLSSALAILQSGASANGYLSSTDWLTFNNKLNGSTALATTAPLTGGGNLSTGLTLAIPQSSSTANGYLSSTDWLTFNGKLASTGVFPVVSSDPGSPADGQAWYNSSSTVLGSKVREAGVTLGQSRVGYVLTADGSTVVSTTVQTATVRTPVFPANFFTVGKTIKISWHGFYSCNATANLAVGFYGNSVSMDGNPANVAAVGANNAAFGGELTIICRSVGASGKFQVFGTQLFDNTAHNFAPASNQATVDTTQAITFEHRLTWTAASAGNIAHDDGFFLEIFDPP